MSMLSGVTRGKIKRPKMVLLYGVDGLGKSTFGAGAPKPIFRGTEQGTAELDVARLPTPKNWEDILIATHELSAQPHDFQSLVVDTLDWAEPLLHDFICREDGSKTIERACEGFGKGYKAAATQLMDWLFRLNYLREHRKMNIILLAHCEAIKFSDPQAQTEYDRYQLKLHKIASALVREYVDAVLFGNFVTTTKTVDPKKTDSKSRAYAEGARMLYTEKRPGFDAKNRYGLPFEIPFIKGQAWDDFVRFADNGNAESKEAILARINGLLIDAPQDVKAFAVDFIAKAGDNVADLSLIEGRLRKRLEGETVAAVAEAEKNAQSSAKP